MKTSAAPSARFQLSGAPPAFRPVVWEAEFSQKGLRRLSLINDTEANTSIAPVSDKRLKGLQRSLLERLKGGRAELDWSAFDLEGSGDFHRRVWRAMLAIPFGETATYSEIALAAGSPLAFRACGQACGANQILIFIPCHRVVAANGLGGFGYGVEWKKRFLAMEKP